jgi:hypothetical protein
MSSKELPQVRKSKPLNLPRCPICGCEVLKRHDIYCAKCLPQASLSLDGINSTIAEAIQSGLDTVNKINRGIK